MKWHVNKYQTLRDINKLGTQLLFYNFSIFLENILIVFLSLLLLYCSLLSFLAQSRPVKSCPILSCSVLPVLSFHVLSCHVLPLLPFISSFVMFCPVPFYPILACPILYIPVLFYYTFLFLPFLSCSVIFCHILLLPVLFCPILFPSCPDLSCPGMLSILQMKSRLSAWKEEFFFICWFLLFVQCRQKEFKGLGQIKKLKNYAKTWF